VSQVLRCHSLPLVGLDGGCIFPTAGILLTTGVPASRWANPSTHPTRLQSQPDVQWRRTVEVYQGGCGSQEESRTREAYPPWGRGTAHRRDWIRSPTNRRPPAEGGTPRGSPTTSKPTVATRTATSHCPTS